MPNIPLGQFKFQVPLKYFDNYFHADTANCYFYMVRDMAEHAFKL